MITTWERTREKIHTASRRPAPPRVRAPCRCCNDIAPRGARTRYRASRSYSLFFAVCTRAAGNLWTPFVRVIVEELLTRSVFRNILCFRSERNDWRVKNKIINKKQNKCYAHVVIIIIVIVSVFSQLDPFARKNK